MEEQEDKDLDVARDTIRDVSSRLPEEFMKLSVAVRRSIRGMSRLIDSEDERISLEACKAIMDSFSKVVTALGKSVVNEPSKKFGGKITIEHEIVGGKK